LQHVVLNHIAERAGGLVVSPAPTFHPCCFSGGNLHLVDEPPVEKRLEDRVGEPEDEDVLHGLFSEIVIYPEYLRFVEISQQRCVETPRRCKVAPERLFDHQSLKSVAFLGGPAACLAQMFCYRGERFRRHRQVEQVIALGLISRVELAQPLAKRFVLFRSVGVRDVIEPSLCEAPPERFVNRLGTGMCLDGGEHLIAELLVASRPAGDAEHC
jgi:hypothetical protein